MREGPNGRKTSKRKTENKISRKSFLKKKSIAIQLK